ncbi:homeobox protein HD1 [Selaginella moellendorffii]|nr:homeobox protein HD1 [Selaginella moellendorffii]|eukprot:XP_024529848.1 homeobox protein HD1 [Selaginella moellendorffii]
MAFNLPHNMSLQQLTELQEAVVASTAATTTSATTSRFNASTAAASDTRHAGTTTSSTAITIATAGSTKDQAATDATASRARSRQQDDDGDGGVEDEDDEEEQAVEAGGGRRREEDGGGRDQREQALDEGGDQDDQGGDSRNPSLLLLRGKNHKAGGGGGLAPSGPTWLSNAVMPRQPSPSPVAAAGAPNYSQWLAMPQPQVTSTDLGEQSHDAAAAAAAAAKGFLEHLHGDTANSGGGVGGDMVAEEQGGGGGGMDSKLWQSARLKADLVTHPLYEQLLSAHISCLRTATPVDQLPKIDAQLAHSSQVAAKYSILATNEQGLSKDKDEVNEFMAHYVTLLRSFKDQLQQHVRVHAMEAVVACWELEQSLFTLTGVSPGEGTGATMSEDEDDQQADSDSGYYDAGMDGHDFTGFGPLIPTETERTLMERVRHELKIELKQGYKAKINDVREEILRKRRAGKLPGDTTSVLKTWWHAHSKWPYPSEDDKARLVQETGLELKQINNWFINQRKRNWHSNPSSSTSLKNKRKR